jgi:hypothetical protein
VQKEVELTLDDFPMVSYSNPTFIVASTHYSQGEHKKKAQKSKPKTVQKPKSVKVSIQSEPTTA